MINVLGFGDIIFWRFSDRSFIFWVDGEFLRNFIEIEGKENVFFYIKLFNDDSMENIVLIIFYFCLSLLDKSNYFYVLI